MPSLPAARRTLVAVLVVAGDPSHQLLGVRPLDVVKESAGSRLSERRREPAVMPDHNLVAAHRELETARSPRHGTSMHHGNLDLAPLLTHPATVLAVGVDALTQPTPLPARSVPRARRQDVPLPAHGDDVQPRIVVQLTLRPVEIGERQKKPQHRQFAV
ncbi:hypothetical protein NQ160_08055 [Microbacterium sp. zg.Y909]|nr:hypothetical protein [Microbacterium sp. zg.Y909]